MKIVFDSEAELESYIEDRFNETGILCIDHSTPNHLLRQLNLGSYGIADLVAISSHQYSNGHVSIDVTVYELKKEIITASAFSQVSRYATAIKDSIEDYCESCDVNVSCVLVGTEIDESCYMLNHSEFLFYKAEFKPSCGVVFSDMSEGWAKSSKEIAQLTELVNSLIIIAPRD